MAKNVIFDGCSCSKCGPARKNTDAEAVNRCEGLLMTRNLCESPANLLFSRPFPSKKDSEAKWSTVGNAFSKMDVDGNHQLSRAEWGSAVSLAAYGFGWPRRRA